MTKRQQLGIIRKMLKHRSYYLFRAKESVKKRRRLYKLAGVDRREHLMLALMHDLWS